MDDSDWSFAYNVYGNDETHVNWSNTTISHPQVHHRIRAISAVMCSLSIMGSLAIILSYILIKDIRSKARELLVHLSIMDLTFSGANLIGIILPYDKYIFHETSGTVHDNFLRVCKAQAFLAVYGTIGSFLWTLGLAVYLYYRIVSGNMKLTKRVVRVLYVVCYILPLYVALWLLMTDHYGYPVDEEYSGGWCTVLAGSNAPESEQFDLELVIFMVDDIWILSTFIAMVPIYLIVYCQVRSEVKEYGRQFLFSSGEKHLSLLRADQKFLLVPFVFMALRIWDLVTSSVFVYSQLNYGHTKHYQFIVYLAAIGDSAQGFLNFLLFCVFQKRVRQCMLQVAYKCLCCKKYRLQHDNDKFGDDDDSFTASGTPSQLSNFSSDPPRNKYEN